MNVDEPPLIIFGGYMACIVIRYISSILQDTEDDRLPAKWERSKPLTTGILQVKFIHVVTGNVVEGNFLAQLVNAELDKPILRTRVSRMA